jgi:hypothetical protein
MSFLNPILLLGLFGAAVPIIIHLIHKHKPKKQSFAAIELLLRSIERVERKWRLKRFLLLASRVALLAALALAAAGPLFGTEKHLIAMTGGPKRLGIVVDCSLSMRAKYGETSAFQRAIAAARSLVDAMGPEDQAIIVAAKATPEVLVPRPTAERKELYGVLDRLEASFAGAEVGDAVSAAASALTSLNASGEEPVPSDSAAPQVETRVIVLSDLAAHAFQSPADLSLPNGKAAALEIIDVISGISREERVNHAITGIVSANVPGRAPRTVELRARIQSFTLKSEGKPVPTDITLFGPAGELERGAVDVVAGTVVDKIVQHAFDAPGFVPVHLELEHDHLAEDDVRYTNIDVRRQVRVLVVNGDPSGVPKEDEIFYFERALEAGAGDQPAPRVITADDLTRADLAAFDVIVLAGVPTFMPTDGPRLVDFVEKGGGLFVTASEDLDVELYNAELGRVLPRPLRTMKNLDPESGGIGADGLVTLNAPQLDHPVLEIFDSQAVGGLLSTRTRAYLLLEPVVQAAETKVLISYEDGQPALLERNVGLGKTMLLTTSVDRDLTDLPIRPAFVPLMRRIVLELGRALSRPDPRNTVVGDIREITVAKGTARVTVLAPDGRETDLAVEHPDAGGFVEFTETRVPGHYVVRLGGVDVSGEESFTVNVDARESDLRSVSTEEASAILLGTADVSASAESGAVARAKALRGLANPEMATMILLILMLVAFVAESILTGQKIGR